MALTQIPGIGRVGAKKLLDGVASAVELFQRREELPQLLQGVSENVVKALDSPAVFDVARKEYEFVEKNHIRCLTLKEKDYPMRLRDCDDAPVALFFKGEVDFNVRHVLAMVGTRRATDYGKQLCLSFLTELKELCPDVLVVSGLAYGIDINSHRSALSVGFPTVGVLAHGLDRIYPALHRTTALKMLSQGGLISEYPSGTNPDPFNFVSRNRIIAGLADAVLVVESAEKGGSLITADIAESYHRDCFAFPGRLDDYYSKGCNRLIRDNKASLLLSAEDFVVNMGWSNSKKAVQRELFPELSEEENVLVKILRERGDMQINTLVVEVNMPVYKVSSLLFELEMKGVVRSLAGGIYQLLSF